MKLIYANIIRFRNIVNQEVNFSDKYAVTFSDGNLVINEKEDDGVMDAVFGGKLISDLTVIVGKTGSGKTNLLQLIGMDHYQRYDIPNDNSFLLLYQYGRDRFVVETFNLTVRGIGRGEDRFNAYKFCYDIATGSASNVERLSAKDLGDTYILNSFDRNAFTFCPFDDVQEESVRPEGDEIVRIAAPFGRSNVELVCEYIKEYISHFPADSIKRKASLVIKCNNWRSALRNELSPKLKKKEYRTYEDDRWDSRFRTKKKCVLKEDKTPKQKFIHDLLTDYAIHLRKWIDALLTDEDLISRAEEWTFGYIVPLPDGQPMKISKRIECLGMIIDQLTDEMFASGHGLVWQITSDIKDIGTLLYQLDDKYFTEEKFEIPIEDMDFNPLSPIGQLFERMSRYRPDEVGVFRRELLPYTFTHLSSGEYQYTKIFGLIEEYANRMKVTQQGESYEKATHPNFIFLLDEPENYMHPEMCRNFISKMSEIISRRNPNTDLQIIMATHSPFMLSDVLTRQVVRMDYDEQGLCQISQNSERSYFAANMFTILADSFFLDYTIGEYARTFLTEKFAYLRNLVNQNNALSDEQKQQVETIRKIVPQIGDEMIRYSFEHLLKHFNL